MRTAALLLLALLLFACRDDDPNAAGDADSASGPKAAAAIPPPTEPPDTPEEGLPKLSPPAHDEALVETTSGEVSRRDTAEEEWRPLARGDRLRDGAEIRLAEDSGLVLVFSRDGRLEAEGPTRLRLPLVAAAARTIELSSGTISRLTAGKVVCGIEVETRRTLFIAVQDGAVGVTVEGGTATFRTFAGESVRLVHGDTIEALRAGESRTVTLKDD